MSPKGKRLRRNQKNNDSDYEEEYSITDVMAKLISIEKSQSSQCSQINDIKSSLDEIKETQNILQNNYKLLVKTTDK